MQLGGGFKYLLILPYLRKWYDLMSIFFKWVVQPLPSAGYHIFKRCSCNIVRFYFPECAWKGVPTERCIWTHVPSTSINSAVGTHLHGEVIDEHVQLKRYILLLQKAVFTSPYIATKTHTKKYCTKPPTSFEKKINDFLFSFPTFPILFGVSWESLGPWLRGSGTWTVEVSRQVQNHLRLRWIHWVAGAGANLWGGTLHQACFTRKRENKGVGMRKVNQLGSMGLVIFPKILAMKINHSCR